MGVQKKSKVKTILMAIFIVLCVACISIDAWWLYIFALGPEKEVVNTFNVGAITTKPDEEGNTESEYVIKVKYFSNQNKNGLECLDVQFSGFVDEEQTEIYSWGIQFVANSQEDDLATWIYNVDKSSISGETRNEWEFPLTWKYYYNIWGSYTPENASIHYYKSSDNFVNDITGASSMGNGEGFLIQLNEDENDDIYKLNFNYNVVNDSNENSNFITEKLVNAYSTTIFYRRIEYYDYYYSYDIYDFAYMLYNQVQAVANGKHSASLINLPDMFTYQIFNGNTYEDVSEAENPKVSETVRNMYAIYIEKTADGVRTANDSMFKCVNGTPQFNLTEVDESGNIFEGGDYFVGTTIINCDIYDFDFIKIKDTTYALDLSDTFMQTYEQYSDKIQLSICIDLDELEKHDIVFYDFVTDSRLSKFNIFECYTTQTVDGNIVRTEVQYV